MGFPAGDDLSKDLLRPFENPIHHQKVMPDIDPEETPVFLEIRKDRIPVFPAEGYEFCAV
jgi:hypothetical protein